MDLSRTKKQQGESKETVDIFGTVDHGERQSPHVHQEGEPARERAETHEQGADNAPYGERGTVTPGTGTPSFAPYPQLKSELARRLEFILQDGLDKIFWDMPPAQQAAFRAKGEETARTIETLLGQAKAAAGTILSLVRAWLKMIPGINALFLEQEAKIKTDKIMGLSRNHEDRYR